MKLSLLQVNLSNNQNMDLLFVPSGNVIKKDVAGKTSLILIELNFKNVPTRDELNKIINEGRLVFLTQKTIFSLNEVYAKLVTANNVNSLVIKKGELFENYPCSFKFGSLGAQLYGTIAEKCKVVGNVLPEAAKKLKACEIK